jgi:hypothetical protein
MNDLKFAFRQLLKNPGFIAAEKIDADKTRWNTPLLRMAAKLEDLWKYYWHLDWQPPVTRPK